MGKINGTTVLLYHDGIAIGHSTNATLSPTMATRDITDKSSGGWEEVAPALRSWQMTGDFWFNKQATEGFTQQFARYNSRALVNVRISDETTGSKAYTGSGYIVDFPATFPLEETATYSVTIKGTGPLAETTIT
jgi:hypothetical protein